MVLSLFKGKRVKKIFIRYPVTFSIIGANFVLFIMFGPLLWGDINPVFLLGEEGFFLKPWTVLTYSFMHVSWGHLIMNMLALLTFCFLETKLGWRTFLGFYLTAAIVAGVYILLFGNADFTVGASGAVFALFGFELIRMIKEKDKKNLVFLGILLAANVGFSLLPGVSWAGHLGGFATGVVFASLWYLQEKRTKGTDKTKTTSEKVDSVRS